MNYRIIFNLLGKVGVVFAALLTLPCILALCLEESSWWAFAITVGISLAVGLTLMLAVKPKTAVMFSREGFVVVSFAWIYVAAIGALPFVISGAIPNFVDAFFETCSGFSTTGATILTGPQIDAMGKALHFWRSFTHWIGGMGVIVFLMAFSDGSKDKRSIHLLRAEMPGHTVDKLVPKARNTAKILYLIYIVLTVVLIVALLIAGMPFFDSVVHAMSTAGTGGFSINSDSIASYNPACQWIIALFMVIFGINFNLFFLLIVGRIKSAIRSTELWLYLGIITASAAVIAVSIFRQQLVYTQNVADAIRHSVFQVASYVSTTGSSTIPNYSSINDWSTLSKTVLLLLMFVGGCAGSTAGGLKVSRVGMLGCSIRQSLRKALHPHNVNSVKFDGKVLTDETQRSITGYFALYVTAIAAVFLVLCFDPAPGLNVETNLASAVSCFNNVGPSLGVAASGMYVYSPLSKIVLSFAMLMGRLEMYPMILAFSPSTWSRR